MKRELLERVESLRREKRRFVVVTDLADGAQWILDPDAEGGEAEPALAQRAAAALRRDRSEAFEAGERRLFLHVFNPPLRLFLVGAVHITQPLSEMAARAGFEVAIIDPRTAFASEARFPGVEISTEWPDRALGKLALDARCAVVTLTHDPKLDDPALQVALRSPAFYIGSLGSRKTHAARLGRLRKEGFGDADIARIHGPVGLAIGAQSPAEIAVSVLAEIIRTLRDAPD
jgi:xanthine dehydrogenase accessory factor